MTADSPKPESPAPHGEPIRVLLATNGWPSGILDVGSWASQQAGAEVCIFQIPPEPPDGGSAWIDKLRQWRPDVVGFRVEGEPFEPILQWIQAVRRFSSALVVLGGPTATSHAAELLQWFGADYVFAGEAEESFALFLDFIRRPEADDMPARVPGLAYRCDGRTVVNTRPAGDRDHAAAGFPITSRETLAANRLDWSLLEGFERPFDSLYFTGGRGCPGVCTFCAKLHGSRVRIKSAEQLLEEIEQADQCVAQGRLQVTRWPLFAQVDDEAVQTPRTYPETSENASHGRKRRKVSAIFGSALKVAWAAIYDEDFFLNVPRAVEFFERWSESPLRERYRISLQTNPCSMLDRHGEVYGELLRRIDHVKPMVQLGAESFNPRLLTRWRKRHNLGQLNTVLDALDTTGQDYTVFQLLTDFDTTAEELIETLRLLILAGFAHRRMRIAVSPFTIPLYASETRRHLESTGRLTPERIGDFRDYERPHPEWMDRTVAELADLADAKLHWALNAETRDAALAETMPAVVEHLRQSPTADSAALLAQAQAAADEIADARFQFPETFG